MKQGKTHDNTMISSEDFNNIANQELKNATKLLKVIYGDNDIILEGLEVNIGVDKLTISKGVALSKNDDLLLELKEDVEKPLPTENSNIYIKPITKDCDPQTKICKEKDGSITNKTIKAKSLYSKSNNKEYYL